MVLMSASIAPISAAVSVSSTIQYTAPSSARERTRNSVANSAADRKLSVLKTLAWRKEFVPIAAQRLNHIEVEAMIDFRTQSADVAFDDAGLRIEMDAPDILQQHPSREYAIRIAHEVLQQAKFLRQQIDRLARAHHGALEQIQVDRAHRQPDRRIVRVGRTARQDSDPRQQLRECERFDQVVVSPGLEALHAIVDSAHGGEVDHRGRDLALPQTPHEIEAIETRQHAIQNDDIGRA